MASLGVRGANPIWVEVDLTGNLFDDTFFLFVLTNTIPYIPANVYHDPDLSIVWTQPIQFLANGTLPIDIFFDPKEIYRLEFRKGNTQSDPLIYEVNNYSAAGSGTTPIDMSSPITTNQISNPQFPIINFVNPTTYTAVTNPAPINIGADWDLLLTGTGSVTIERVALNNSNQNPSNAPYALHLTLAGWNAGQCFLRQRFFQNGMLWANKIVSSALTARSQGASLSLTATLVDSNGTTLGQVLNVPTVNSDWNEYTGHFQLPATTNPNVPPAAFIDYLLSLPNNGEIYLTSFQLIAEDEPIEQEFIQDSINRQIDLTYHDAYPIVPIGTIIDFYGFGIPLHYLTASGQAISRITFNQLFNVITNTETVTLTSGSPTFTVTNGLIYAIGSALEGTGIAATTTITNIVSNTITMSLNATALTSSLVRFFPAGNGDGSTTFNVPNFGGFVSAGAFSSILPSGGVGEFGGNASTSLLATNIPPHVHTYSTPSVIGSAFQSGTGFVPASNITGTGTDPSGTIPLAGTAFSNLQPTILVQKIIRFE